MNAKATKKAPTAKAIKIAKGTAEKQPEAAKPAPGKKPAAEKKPPAKKEPKAKKPSALEAAAKVLGEAGSPMNCQEMIKAMADKGYWSSPEGKTPHATLYTAVTMLPCLAP